MNTKTKEYNPEVDLYKTLIRCAAAILIMFILTGFGNCQYTKYSVITMVEAGADPVVASCAVKENYSTSMCIAYKIAEKSKE